MMSADGISIPSCTVELRILRQGCWSSVLEGFVCACRAAAGLCGVLFYHLVVCSDSAHGGNGTFSG